MSGIIESIKAYPAKGEAGRELAEGRLIENLGLEGDFYARGGERQLSLILSECRDMLAEQKKRGLCFSRFRENISVSGLAPDALRPGVRLEAGEAALEITGETKHCHEECSLYEEGKLCSLAGLNLFARVVKSGLIQAGNVVELVSPK
jgi:cyclic pyranopterin phosphate synthase